VPGGLVLLLIGKRKIKHSSPKMKGRIGDSASCS
jgi:hypothetical protein